LAANRCQRLLRVVALHTGPDAVIRGMQLHFERIARYWPKVH